MLERSRNVKVAVKGGRLLVSGRPYRTLGVATGKSKEIQRLEKQHRKLFSEQPAFVRPEYESLEQPYAGEIVETVTTYSVYEEPIREE